MSSSGSGQSTYDEIQTALSGMPIAQLRAVPVDTLIRNHDLLAGGSGLSVTPDFYANELLRRETVEQNKALEKLTKQLEWLTKALVILGVVTLGIVIYDVFLKP